MGGVGEGRPVLRPADLSAATAVILVGGLGTRLAPVVADRPKVLAHVGARPFLGYLLDGLASAGLRRVLLCSGHRGDELRAAVGTRYRGMQLDYSHEPAPAGTGGALRLAAMLSDGDPLLVMNGDSYCEVDLAALWSAHHARGASATMVVSEVADARRFGRVTFDEAGRVTGFSEKSPETGPGWVNAGVYVLGRALVCAIPERAPLSLEHEVLPSWIGRGLLAHPVRGSFFDIGTPPTYADAQAQALEIGRTA